MYTIIKRLYVNANFHTALACQATSTTSFSFTSIDESPVKAVPKLKIWRKRVKNLFLHWLIFLKVVWPFFNYFLVASSNIKKLTIKTIKYCQVTSPTPPLKNGHAPVARFFLHASLGRPNHAGDDATNNIRYLVHTHTHNATLTRKTSGVSAKAVFK